MIQYPIYTVKAKNLVNLANDAQQFMAIPKGMVGTLQAVEDPSNLGNQSNILIEAKFPVSVTNGQYGFIRFKPKYQPTNGDIRAMILTDFSILRTAKFSTASYTNADGDSVDVSTELSTIKTMISFTLFFTAATWWAVNFSKNK